MKQSLRHNLSLPFRAGSVSARLFHFKGMGGLLLLLAAIISLQSCSPKTVAVPVESSAIRVDTLFKVIRASDTVTNSDTVIITPERTEIVRWRVRQSLVHDTVYRVRTDTIRREIPVEIPAKCRDSWSDNLKKHTFWPLIAIITTLLALILYKQRTSVKR